MIIIPICWVLQMIIIDQWFSSTTANNVANDFDSHSQVGMGQKPSPNKHTKDFPQIPASQILNDF